VLAFYPGAFTSVCTKEMCTFRDSLAKLNELKAQVIGISVNDPFSNKAFAEANSLSFPLLSDYNRKVVELYGVRQKTLLALKATQLPNAPYSFWTAEAPFVTSGYQKIHM